MDNDMPEKIIPSSPDFRTKLVGKIAEIAPEVISDRKLDVTKLRELVNGDVETATEKFGLFWPGKARAQAVAQIPTSATLIPAPDESVDWENTKNIFIEGDNLEVLKALQNSYRRKIKMIYIDPPYNTGKEFIYPDNFKEGLATYLEYTGQKNEAGEKTESKEETGGRRHSNWLNMMYPRLQLAKSLLTDDGVIFISIDDNEQANLKKLCDEIFGEDNYAGDFIWQKQGNDNKSIFSGVKTFRNDHDFVIVYARNQKLVEFERPEEDAVFQNEYGNADDDFRGNWMSAEFGKSENRSIPHGKNYYTLTTPNGTKYTRQWHYSEKELKELSNDNRVYFGKDGGSVPRLKKFLTEKIKKVPSSLLTKYGSTKVGQETVDNLFDGKRFFDYPKPVELIEFFTKLSTNGSLFVLDFFSGSATTAHAVMQLNAEDGGNRTHIQVQLPEPTDEKSEAYKAGYRTISDIGKERIRRAGKKILTDNTEKLKERERPLDTGFRVYKLASSNFVQWDENEAKNDIQQAVLDFASNKKSDATPEALLTEIMLQTRIPLSAKIEKLDLSSGGWVYVVDGGNLIAYVASEQITEDQAREIADMAPAKLVILDSAFNGNDALKINIKNICKEKFIKEFKTI